MNYKKKWNKYAILDFEYRQFRRYRSLWSVQKKYYLINKENIIAREFFSFYSINKACIVVNVLALNVDMIFSSFICAFN